MKNCIGEIEWWGGYGCWDPTQKYGYLAGNKRVFKNALRFDLQLLEKGLKVIYSETPIEGSASIITNVRLFSSTAGQQSPDGGNNLSSVEEIISYLNNESNITSLNSNEIISSIDAIIEGNDDVKIISSIILPTKLGLDYLWQSNLKLAIFETLLSVSDDKFHLINTVAPILSTTEIVDFISKFEINIPEMVFVTQSMVSESVDCQVIEAIKQNLHKEQNTLEKLTVGEFFNYTPKRDIYCQILFIKKALWLYQRSSKDHKILSYCLAKLPDATDVDNHLTKCLISLLNLFDKEMACREEIVRIIGKTFWEFLEKNQVVFKNNKHIMLEYFKLLLPWCDKSIRNIKNKSCVRDNRFREARFRKTKEEVEMGYKEWHEKQGISKQADYTGGIVSCTGEFSCRKDKCYHAATFAFTDPKEDFSKITLIELFNILGFDIMATRNDVYKTYTIDILCGWINRLFLSTDSQQFCCSKCKKLMIPASTQNEEAYNFDWTSSVLYFRCKTINHDQDVYISHCKNPNCVNTIDSRTSKYKCSNGKYICPVCNFCNCSTHIDKYQMTGINYPCPSCYRVMQYDDSKGSLCCEYCKVHFPWKKIDSWAKSNGMHTNSFVLVNCRSQKEEVLNDFFLPDFKLPDTKTVNKLKSIM